MQLRRTLIGVLTLLGALTMPGVADAAPGVTAIGALERFPQEAVDAFGPDFTDTSSFLVQIAGGTLLPVPGANQLWQIYPHRSGSPQTGVLVRDADSRHVIHSFVIPDALDRATVSFGGEWLHATDGGRRVFLVSSGQRALYEVDAESFTVRRHPFGIVPQLPNIALQAAGVTYDPSSDSLLVLYGGPGALFTANRLTVLQRIDPATGATESRIIRSCTGPLPQTDIGGDTIAAELLLGDDAVYLTCQKQLRGLFGPPTLDDDTRALVVKLPRATLWESDGEESPVEAGRRFNAAPVDPGSGRIAVVDWAGLATVVDVDSMSVVGTFNVSSGTTLNRFGLGLDTTRGRVFVQSDLGFGYLDIGSTPLSSPVLDATAAGPGQERIVPDGNKVYVLPGTASPSSPKPDRYTIYNVAP